MDNRRAAGFGPLYGLLVVLRHQARVRAPGRRALAGAGALAGVAVLAAALRPVLFGPVAEYSAPHAAALSPWLTVSAIAAVLLMLPLAAAAGAGAAPTREAEAQTQAALLARLTAWDLACGRLIAVLSPLWAAVAASCLFWMAAQATTGGLVRGRGALLSILGAHLIVACATAMVGAVSLLCALRRTPGRSFVGGLAAGLALAALCIGAVFAAAPAISRADDPSRLITATLAVNPAYAVETALRRDITRVPWVYDHTPVADYQYTSPAPWVSGCLYAGLALGALYLAALRLHRACRCDAA